MKKKLLTTVLTVGVILSLVGCGAKETTSSESVAETTEVTTEYGTEETTVEEVVEETTVAETEAVEETEATVLSEETKYVNEALTNFEAEDYVSLNITYTNYLDGTEKVTDLLIDRVNNVACMSEEDNGILYYDFKNKVAYTPNGDMTGFYKSASQDVEDLITATCNVVLKQWFEANTEYELGEIMSLMGTDTRTIANWFTDSETGNEFQHRCNIYEDGIQIYQATIGEFDPTAMDESGANTDEYSVSFTNIIVKYPEEGTDEFTTFQTALTLPTDDECILIEGETTTTE